MTFQNKLRTLLVVTPILLAGLTSIATVDTAAAGSRTANRASAPRSATATNQGVSHIEVNNQNKATPGAKTDKLCPGHRCHHTHGDH
jgi:hypothetical protein